MAPVNPKDIAAQTEGRARLDLLEPAADEQIVRALAAGADKYGLRNFTISQIEARTYVAAMRRHLTAFLRGEDFAEDTGFHHLAHVGANVHVVLAAIEASTFIDDRSPAPAENPYLPTEYADNLDVEDCSGEGCKCEDDYVLKYDGCTHFDAAGNPRTDTASTFDLVAAVEENQAYWETIEDEPVFETCPASHEEIADFWQDAGRPADDAVEAPTFKVGDRVRVTTKNYRIYSGQEGTIAEIRPLTRGSRCVFVEFDDFSGSFPFSHLTLVEEKPPVRRRAVLTFGARGSEVLPS